MVIIGSLGLLLFFAIPAISFLRFSRIKSPLKLGSLFAVIHFFLVSATLIMISRLVKEEYGLIWLISPLYFLDFPSSLLTNLITKSIGYNFMRTNFTPAVVFALVGSTQFFLIGVGIGWLYNKFTKRSSPAPKRPEGVPSEAEG